MSERYDFPFLHGTAVRSVLAALGDGETRFVGGCVRDALAGRKVGDLDLATILLPAEVMARLEKAGLKAVPTGLAHGTVTAVAEGQPFEITTLRRDVRTDGRHAEVAFTDDWQIDAARRDFTMNAMSLGVDGVLHDFFGGQADLAAGRVRFVGVAAQRIREDVLRILRFFRFYAHFGRGAPDAEGLAACRALVDLLPTLAFERVRMELLKLLKAEDPVPAWRLMVDVGALAALTLPLGNLDPLEQVVVRERSLQQIDPLRRLWAAMDEGVDVAALAEKLRLSRAEAGRLLALSRHAASAAAFVRMDERALFRSAYDLGAETLVDALVVGAGTAAQLAALKDWEKPVLPLAGRDLQQAGFADGPEMGTLLKAVERWWVQADFAPDKAACLAEARRLARQA